MVALIVVAPTGQKIKYEPKRIYQQIGPIRHPCTAGIICIIPFQKPQNNGSGGMYQQLPMRGMQ